ncbi:MAG: DsrE family protein [Methanomicrobiales archaeon]|jgi:tRNA 2-thiouridine synthesizing protein C
MASYFLLAGPVSRERLSWLVDCLKFFYVTLAPEAFLRPATDGETAFIFFITGDALYSLVDKSVLLVWEIILLLPSTRIVIDREELDLRGLSLEPLKMKYPGQIVDQVGGHKSHPLSFWREVVGAFRKNEPGSGTIGYLHLKSPYMNRPSLYAISCLRAALEEKLSVELYAYLDGVHTGHRNQRPTGSENIGQGFEDLKESARERGLQFLILASEACAKARGYAAWDDGNGVVISTCSIKPFKIRDLRAIVDRFALNHIILGESVSSVRIRKEQKIHPEDWLSRGSESPPIVILITGSPYDTENTSGGLSLAIACAHRGIETRIVFLEDGIYALTGTHITEGEASFFNIQDVINAAAESNNIQLFAFYPSFHQRGVQKNPKLEAVFEIGIKELGEILFNPPKGVRANHQRILFF